MVSIQTNMEINTESNTELSSQHHKLHDKWCLFAHLPHDTNWGLDSYIKIHTMDTVESTIALTETLPAKLIENCMLFVMRQGINPIWEDPKNRNGGCFSYKVTNKNVQQVWKELTYVLVGNSISEKSSFVSNVTGITISPKRHFCIVKIWMSNCTEQNAAVVTGTIKNLNSQGCIFKKHTPEY